ncbi:MAG: phospholipase D-like domain-containing protein, partial [Phycisphaeraceae bacterium]
MPGFTDISWIAALIFTTDWVIRLGFALRVVMRRRSVGASLSWIGVIVLLPFVGAIIYLILGENRIGRLRGERFERIRPQLERYLDGLNEQAAADPQSLAPAQRALARHSTNRYGFPLLGGSSVELLPDADAIFARLVRDIDEAERTVHLAYYIWWNGGRVEGVIEALLRARQRGVTCRVLADAVGSKQFLRSGVCRRLRASGVEVVEVLPVGVWRMLFRRQDLRNHRKIAVIDGEIGYTGSMNMADPKTFKHEVGVGQWLDAMVRVTGPAVQALGLVFLSDFDTETDEAFGDFEAEGGLHDIQPTGSVVTQLLPSGPGFAREAIRETLLTAIFGAQ